MTGPDIERLIRTGKLHIWRIPYGQFKNLEMTGGRQLIQYAGKPAVVDVDAGILWVEE